MEHFEHSISSDPIGRVTDIIEDSDCILVVIEGIDVYSSRNLEMQFTCLCLGIRTVDEHSTE